MDKSIERRLSAADGLIVKRILSIVLALLVALPLPAWAGPMDSWNDHHGAQLSFEHGDERIAYQDRGYGPAILMVHGTPTSSWIYRKLTEDLVHRGYRVILPDLVGFGASSKPDDPLAVLPGLQAERLLALMEQLEIQSWTLVCHDLGGPVAFELLERAPERVERLVMLNTVVFAEGWNQEGERARMLRLKRIAQLVTRRERRAAAATRALLKEGLARRRIGRDERVVEGYLRPLAAGADTVVLSSMTSHELVSADLPRYRSTLAKLDLPTLIVWGEEDEILLAEEQVPRLTDLLGLPPERVVRLEGCGHYLPEECAPRIGEHIGEFFRSTPSAGPTDPSLPAEEEDEWDRFNPPPGGWDVSSRVVPTPLSRG